jgi:biotin carboxylase
MKKTILILGAGEEQAIAIKLAQNMGIRVIAVDGNPKAVGLKIADVGIYADIKDTDKMLSIAKKYKVNGVMTHAVEIPQIVAKIAENLGLPGIRREVAERATNKLKRIICFKKNGIPHPNFKTARTIKEAEQKSEKIGFPVVVKPIDNAGSRGVIKVNTRKEIRKAFSEAKSFSKKNIILIEKYLEGPEISTESVIYKKKIYTPCWADRNYSKKELYYPYMIEDGGDLPTVLSKKNKELVEKTVKMAIKALGINFGAAKGDILIHRGTPYIIEMAARTSGGRFCDTKVPLSNGVNILKPLINMHVGNKINPTELKPKYELGVSERTIIPEPGKIISIRGIKKAQKMTGVYKIYMKPEIKIGGYVRPIRNHANKVGYIVAIGNTQKTAVEIAERAVKLIKIKTVDKKRHQHKN